MCYTKTKEKKEKNGLLNLYISFTIKQNIYSTIYMIRAPD